MKKTITTQKSQSGYSIIEITVVLAIMLSLAAIVFTAVAKVRQKSTINAYVSDITSIRSGIDSLYAGQSHYKGLGPGVLFEAGLYPASFDPSSPWSTPFDGLIVIGDSAMMDRTEAGLSSGKLYSIAFAEYTMPQAVCVGVVLKAGMSFSAVAVNGNIVKGRNSPTVDVVKTTEICSEFSGGYYLIEFISQ